MKNIRKCLCFKLGCKMDAKTRYTKLVENVKNEIAKDRAKFDRIKERNQHQEKYKELWEKVNIDEVVEKFAPNS